MFLRISEDKTTTWFSEREAFSGCCVKIKYLDVAGLRTRIEAVFLKDCHKCMTCKSECGRAGSLSILNPKEVKLTEKRPEIIHLTAGIKKSFVYLPGS